MSDQAIGAPAGNGPIRLRCNLSKQGVGSRPRKRSRSTKRLLESGAKRIKQAFVYAGFLLCVLIVISCTGGLESSDVDQVDYSGGQSVSKQHAITIRDNLSGTSS